MSQSRLRANFIAGKRGILTFLGLVLLVLAIAIASVWAANGEQNVTIKAGEIRDNDLYLTAKTVTIDGTVRGTAAIAAETIVLNGTVEDDVYLAAETVTVNGTVRGDAVLAGRQVRINGTVEEDAIAAGQSVAINGTVGDDLRAAGEVLLLDTQAEVADDVMAAGASLESKVGSSVGSNLNFSGGQALLAGTIQKNAIGAIGSVALYGIVDGNVNLAVGNSKSFRPPFAPEPAIAIPEVPVGLTVADSAQIGGNLTYLSQQEAKISPKARIAGDTVREKVATEVKVKPPPSPAQVFLGQLRRFATLVLVGGVLLQLKPSWTQTLAQTARAQPLPSLGWGLVSFVTVGAVAIAIAISTTLLAFLFAFTLQGLVLPVLGLGMLANFALLLGFGIFISFIPQIALSYLGGRTLLQKIEPAWASKRWLALCLGLALFVAISAIPIAGQIFSLIIVCLGLGALWIRGRQWRQRDRFSEEKPT